MFLDKAKRDEQEGSVSMQAAAGRNAGHETRRIATNGNRVLRARFRTGLVEGNVGRRVREGRIPTEPL
eukprot:11190361-Lingulodinium_polyedra.AAC.1